MMMPPEDVHRGRQVRRGHDCADVALQRKPVRRTATDFANGYRIAVDTLVLPRTYADPQSGRDAREALSCNDGMLVTANAIGVGRPQWPLTGSQSDGWPPGLPQSRTPSVVPRCPR